MRAVRLESRPLVDALERAGVPHQVRGGIGLFERREVRAAVAWLRAACDPSLVQDHLRVGADPRYDLPWGELADAVTSASAAARCRDRRPRPGWPEAHGGRGLAAALADIGRAAAELPPADALRVAIDRSGLRSAAIAAGGAEGAARLAGLAALERLGREIAERDPALDAPALGATLAGLAAIGYRGEGIAPRERIGVQVMTIHQAKGLEFDAVFVVGMTRANFPGKDRGEIDIPDQLLPEVLPRGPRRPRGGVAPPGVRRHDPRPPPPGALHPRRRRERRRAGARRPSSRRPARPWGPRSTRSGRPPSGRCWRPWARRATPPSARRCAPPGRWPRAPTTRRPSARPRPTPPPRWSPRGRR